MSDQILEKLENLLNEEKWTRATINNYTVKNFDELINFDEIDLWKELFPNLQVNPKNFEEAIN